MFRRSWMDEKNKKYEKVPKETKTLSEEILKKINTEENKELKKTFGQLKLKIKLSSEPKLLKNGKICSISKNIFTIYDDKYFKKLYEIKFKKDTKILDTIELNNNYLILLSQEKEKMEDDFSRFYFSGFLNKILIYKLKDKNYVLIQEIKEDMTGFATQKKRSGCEIMPKSYYPEYLKEISNNRFFCVSNYGIKLFSLNIKNEYASILTFPIRNTIKIIHEINEKNFIICSNISHSASLGGPGYTELYIEKIILDSSNVLGMLDLFGDEYYDYSLDYVSLKNKYFAIKINEYIFLFDTTNGNLLKRFEIKFNEISFEKISIKKWNNDEDNEFLLFIDNNIILFQLDEDNFNLKIKGYTSIEPDLEDKNKYYRPNYIKINEKENKFYLVEDNSIKIY